MLKAAKVFVIIGMIFGFWTILPIIFGIMALKTLKSGTKSVGKGVCTLLFVNTIAGILMLCASDDAYAQNAQA